SLTLCWPLEGLQGGARGSTLPPALLPVVGLVGVWPRRLACGLRANRRAAPVAVWRRGGGRPFQPERERQRVFVVRGRQGQAAVDAPRSMGRIGDVLRGRSRTRSHRRGVRGVPARLALAAL